jgi:hypothetical protein
VTVNKALFVARVIKPGVVSKYWGFKALGMKILNGIPNF